MRFQNPLSDDFCRFLLILGVALGPRAAQVAPRAVTKFTYFPRMARRVGNLGAQRLPKDSQVAKVAPKVIQNYPAWEQKC